MPNEITVGVDGSPESLCAAHWAAREARLRGLPLRLLLLWILTPLTAEQIPRGEEQSAAARHLLQETRADLCREYPDVPVSTELLPVDSHTALPPATRDAALVVLGSQGLGAVRGYLLGSLALHTVAASERPVVLVRACGEPGGVGPPPARSAPVVVGLDLRAGRDGTLEFAFDAADRYGAPLLAVHGSARRPPVPGHAQERDEEAVRRSLGAALLPWREKYPAVQVAERISRGSAARAVVEATAGAGLLVVGRGGHRTGPAPRIGPVTHAAVHHAPCPVAVLPGC